METPDSSLINDVDEVAVQRALMGDRTVRLGRADQREAIRRLHVDGVAQPDIAARLSVSLSAVKKAVERAAAKERAS